jgi:hypothetical protein
VLQAMPCSATLRWGSLLASPRTATARLVVRYCRLRFKRLPQAERMILDIAHFRVQR